MNTATEGAYGEQTKKGVVGPRILGTKPSDRSVTARAQVAAVTSRVPNDLLNISLVKSRQNVEKKNNNNMDTFEKQNKTNYYISLFSYKYSLARLYTQYNMYLYTKMSLFNL